MAKLFIELYLDENVHVLVAALLKVRDFQAFNTQEAGRAGQDDASQLAYAASQGKTLLTHNRSDYEGLHRQYMEAARHHAGIIIAVQRPPHEIIRRLLMLMNTLTADEMQDQLLYI
jgi:hypothetical protein